MSIFEKFNDQGLGNRDAFEEMCCQLFETWGKTEMGFDGAWRYCNVRGSGGDGGVEAYWHNPNTDTWIGLQAKWFRKTLDASNFTQIERSIVEALKVRPSMTLYIVCLPHNLTSMKRVKKGGISKGEDNEWSDFVSKILEEHPSLQIDLWDEHQLLCLLQSPENAGSWRFWFEHTAINPQSIEHNLDASIRRLSSRYVPSIIEDGGMSDFLDCFYGTYANRIEMIKEINTCISLLCNLSVATESLIAMKRRLPDEFEDLAQAAEKSLHALADYSKTLALRRKIIADEPDGFVDIEAFPIDYAAIENLRWQLRDLKQRSDIHGHVDVLLKLVEQFESLPSEWGMANAMKTAFGSSHCLVIGDPGTGKTCGFASKARGYLEDGIHVPILIAAVDIEDCNNWRDVIVKSLQLDGGWDDVSLWRALSSFAATRDLRSDGISIRAKVAVLVDGLDEKPPVSRWTDRMHEAEAISEQFPRIKFAYSSRPNGVDPIMQRDLGSCKYYIDDQGDVPASELFDRYIAYYGIEINGNESYRWMLRTPMELRLFCSAHKGRRLVEGIETNTTALIEGYVTALESEYAARYDQDVSRYAQPLRKALIHLAEYFLKSDTSIERDELIDLLNGLEMGTDPGRIIDFLNNHGILIERRLLPDNVLRLSSWSYRAGSRPVWDYIMAVILDQGNSEASELLRNHPDAALMYGIILVEKRGILPIECEKLVEVAGKDDAQSLSLHALAFCHRNATAKFRCRVLDKMAISQNDLFDVVNSVVVVVAHVKNHPLGPLLLDEYLQSFESPFERDAVWSVPRKYDSNPRFALYEERCLVEDLPRLHKADKWNQMPLLLAWCLSSVSNLKRCCCRNELVKWSLNSPAEFFELFAHFDKCNDPQIREDLFAIAEEVICQGAASAEVEKKFGEMVLASVFAEPDKVGNRDAAIRFYARMIIERCYTDGLLDDMALVACRPPYRQSTRDGVLPVYADACGARRMCGYWPIDFDLARYVLVDRLEYAFGLHRQHVGNRGFGNAVDSIIEQSAVLASIPAPDFEGWVIAAAYQYLLDLGYCPETFAGKVGEHGYRTGGIDWRIRCSFEHATHGSRSTVMSVAEKYVWCARNEICGYLADRVPVSSTEWSRQPWRTEDGMINDYGALLAFDSPLLEATVTDLARKRQGLLPAFPNPFSCRNDDRLCSEIELTRWVNDVRADSATALLEYMPDNILHSIEGSTLALALYASDWGLGGKESRVWAYCGAADPDSLVCLGRDDTVALNGYDNASDFTVGIECSDSVCYISPVEQFSAPWVVEYDEPRQVEKNADFHLDALPLSGSGVDLLADVGDYYYYFPSAFASRLTGVIRTDGAHYFDRDGNVVFEDIRYGEPYRQEYQALVVNRDVMLDAIKNEGKTLVWYVTVHRGTNILANERYPDYALRTEMSWLVWRDVDGNFRHCVISDAYPEREFETDPTEMIRDLIERFASDDELDSTN